MGIVNYIKILWSYFWDRRWLKKRGIEMTMGWPSDYEPDNKFRWKGTREGGPMPKIRPYQTPHDK